MPMMASATNSRDMSSAYIRTRQRMIEHVRRHCERAAHGGDDLADCCGSIQGVDDSGDEVCGPSRRDRDAVESSEQPREIPLAFEGFNCPDMAAPSFDLGRGDV